MLIRILAVALAAMLTAVSAASAGTWHVRAGASGNGSAESPFGTIQEAVNAASAGHTVVIAPGLYAEHVAIGWLKNGLIIRGAGPGRTIIDGGGIGPCVVFDGVHSGSISGLTIRNGLGVSGGGIALYASAPAITNILFAGNRASNGAAIHCDLSSPIISNCTFAANAATGAGGAIAAVESSPVVVSSILFGNSAPIGAEASAANSSTIAFHYSTITGGIGRTFASSTSRVVWGYSNLTVDPLFADPVGGDYHLKSRKGRWNPAANYGQGAWVIDDLHSPCIDTADPYAPYKDEPPPNGKRANIGAYGNTAEASKGSESISGDANGDCVVNVLDLIFIRNRLNLDVASGDNAAADVNEDGRINVLDLIHVRTRLNLKCR